MCLKKLDHKKKKKFVEVFRYHQNFAQILIFKFSKTLTMYMDVSNSPLRLILYLHNDYWYVRYSL